MSMNLFMLGIEWQKKKISEPVHNQIRDLSLSFSFFSESSGMTIIDSNDSVQIEQYLFGTDQ